MALLHIPLDQIDEARLQALIEAATSENRSIEYKRTTYGAAHADHTEFLADISSFANTSGGDIVLGMAATSGVPTEFVPLQIDIDAEKLRLEQIARTGLQPRIPQLLIQPIPIRQGGAVLIVRIPRSYNLPHRIIRQGSSRFWARSSAGKYEPDVEELRRLFVAAPQLADRIRDFRLDRIAKIAAADAPVRLMNPGAVIMHVVPLSAFDTTTTLPLNDISRNFNTFAPIGSRTATGARITFDGVLKVSNADLSAAQQRAYVQLYRSGIIEAANSTIVAVSSGHPIISNFDDSIVANTLRYFNDLALIGIEPPYALLVSLIGVKGARCLLTRTTTPDWYDNLGDTLDRDQYHFGEVIFETIPASPAECAMILRPILDQLANAAGSPQSPIFDAQGRYTPPR